MSTESDESESEETQAPVKTAESELGLDLDLHFLPAWAQKTPAENQYANFKGEERADRGHDRRGGRPPGQGGPRRDFGDRGPRRPGQPGGQRGPGASQNRGRDDRGPRGRPQGQGPRRGGPPH